MTRPGRSAPAGFLGVLGASAGALFVTYVIVLFFTANPLSHCQSAKNPITLRNCLRSLAATSPVLPTAPAGPCPPLAPRTCSCASRTPCGEYSSARAGLLAKARMENSLTFSVASLSSGRRSVGRQGGALPPCCTPGNYRVS
jgi:hypothetical protein